MSQNEEIINFVTCYGLSVTDKITTRENIYFFVILKWFWISNLLEVFRVCLVFRPLVSVYGSFHVIMSSFVPGVCN